MDEHSRRYVFRFEKTTLRMPVGGESIEGHVGFMSSHWTRLIFLFTFLIHDQCQYSFNPDAIF